MTKLLLSRELFASDCLHTVYQICTPLVSLDCLWSPEMHELPGKPSVPIEGDLGDGKGTQGIVGLKVPRYGPTVYLFDGARRTLYELATNPKYRNIILATASSSLEPSYSHACLEAIEIVPGVTMSDMFQ